MSLKNGLNSIHVNMFDFTIIGWSYYVTAPLSKFSLMCFFDSTPFRNNFLKIQRKSFYYITKNACMRNM